MLLPLLTCQILAILGQCKGFFRVCRLPQFFYYYIILRSQRQIRERQPDKFIGQLSLKNNAFSFLQQFYNYSIMQLGERQETNTSDEEGVDLNQTDPPTKTRVYYGFLRACLPFGIHMSIGPDFQLAKMTFIFLLLVSGACYYFSLKFNFQATGQYVTLFFVALPIISFLFTALGNPGVYDYSKNNEPKIKYCKQCELAKPKGVIHCKVCHVCIEGFDHHCPFTSKCVGRKNKISYYVFLFSLFGLFVYFIVLVLMWIFRPSSP